LLAIVTLAVDNVLMLVLQQTSAVLAAAMVCCKDPLVDRVSLCTCACTTAVVLSKEGQERFLLLMCAGGSEDGGEGEMGTCVRGTHHGCQVSGQ